MDILAKPILIESAGEEQGVLAVLQGTFAEYDKENQNRRIYPEALWDKVLADPKLQKDIAEKRLYGELDHPADHMEIIPERTAFCITELHKDSTTKTIKGTAKVLDTPAGRILNTLLRFGSVLGVSSRGTGEVNGQYVDPDTYEFITFDMVTNPSNVGAVPSLIEGITYDSKVNARALMESVGNADEKTLKLIEEAATSFDEETSSAIINKVEERKESIGESQEDPDENVPDPEEKDPEELFRREVLTRLDSIEASLASILELLNRSPEPSISEVEPENPVSEDVGGVTTETNVRVSRVIKAKKRIVENTGDNPVKSVTSVEVENVSVENSSESGSSQRVAGLVESGKSR